MLRGATFIFEKGLLPVKMLINLDMPFIVLFSF